MATLAESLVPSSDRPLSVRMRRDLKIRQHRYQGRLYWVIKEPLGLHYFRFQEEEFFILKALDGVASLADIKRLFDRRFAPQQITHDEINSLIGQLHRSNLLISHTPGQGVQLVKRRGEKKKQQLLATLGNVLCVRFKGIDPERLLNWLYPKVSWFFTRTAVICFSLLGLAALMLVLAQFETFRHKLPTFNEFFSGQNWFILAIALAGTKVLHEFGHGLTCKHFGGECHEMGVLLLVLTPCLYCNVTDSWLLPNKWQRAAIGAAGMYVELCLASVATFVWWFSEPGTLNSLSLAVMFVCSVSTVIFNANPLLRYDGYYILSDVMEIPNLRQKASTILHRKLGSWFLGLEEQDDPFLPKRHQALFALYTVASSIYGWIVSLSILWFLYKVFEPYGLQIIGQLIGLMALFGLVVKPAWKVGKFFYVPGRVEKVKKPRMYLSLAMLGLLVAAALFIPLPYRILSAVEIRPQDGEPVYVDVVGRLEKVLVKAGDQVKKGQELAILSNPDLKLSIVKLDGQKAQIEAQIEAARQRTIAARGGPTDIGAREEELASVTKQLREQEAEQQKLILRAPADGMVLPPASVPKNTQETDKLPTWHDTPLDAKNLGATLEESSQFCEIGDPGKLEAILVIDQDYIDLVREGQRVALRFDALPGRTFEAEIRRISTEPLRTSPRQLSSKYGGGLQSKMDADGVDRPMNTSYQAWAPLEDPDHLLKVGMRGSAKVYGQWQTVAARAWRFFSQTFHFRL